MKGYRLQSKTVKEDAVTLPRISLISVEFVVLLIAVNLGVFRGAFDNDSAHATVLYGMDHAFFFLPMIDVLSIGLYRHWRRRRWTAGAVGFLIAGAVATAVVFGLCVAAPDTMYNALMIIYEPIASATEKTMTRYLGNAAMQTLAGQLLDAVTIELMIPMAIYSTPPLLAALFGGWIARRLSNRALIVAAVQG